MVGICGDFHGRFGEVNKFLTSHKEFDLILQCGDFGYWPKDNGSTYKDDFGKKHTFNQYALKPRGAVLRFVCGNHEDHEELASLNKTSTTEIQPNVHYMKRGSALILPDGRRVLFIGGAASIDKHLRTPGFDWFAQEIISQQDVYNLPDVHVDIVISHTAPEEFNVPLDGKYDPDPSRKALSYILEKYHPKLWYFGHFHTFKSGYDKECRWTCLSGVGLSGRWWTRLED